MFAPTHFTIAGFEIPLIVAWLVLVCGVIPAIAGYLFSRHQFLSPALLVTTAVCWVMSEQTQGAIQMQKCPRRARELQETGHEILIGSFECTGFEFDFELLLKLIALTLPAYLIGWAFYAFKRKLEDRKSRAN